MVIFLTCPRVIGVSLWFVSQAVRHGSAKAVRLVRLQYEPPLSEKTESEFMEVGFPGLMRMDANPVHVLYEY